MQQIHKRPISWKRNLAVIWFAQSLTVIGFTFTFPFMPLFVQELGISGESDRDENLPLAEKERALTEVFIEIEEGVSEEEAREIAVEWARTPTKFVFKEASVPGPTMFDIRSRAGKIFVILNTNHPANSGLFELLKDEDGTNDTPALKSLKLLLEAWARLEDEAEPKRRQTLEDIRLDWGRIARDFLQESLE